jgi:hypothetical protein
VLVRDFALTLVPAVGNTALSRLFVAHSEARNARR